MRASWLPSNNTDQNPEAGGYYFWLEVNVKVE
jgi:hypothetical protein